MRIHDACRKHGLFVPGGSRSRRASVCLTACGHIRQPDACRENTDRAAVELHYRRRRTLTVKLIVRPPRRPVNMSRPSIQIGFVSIHTIQSSVVGESRAGKIELNGSLLLRRHRARRGID